MKKFILPIIIVFLFAGCKKKSEQQSCPEYSVLGVWKPINLTALQNQSTPKLSVAFLLNKPQTTVLKFTDEFYQDKNGLTFNKLLVYDNDKGQMELVKTNGYNYALYNKVK